MWIAAIITAVIARCELVWVVIDQDWSVAAIERLIIRVIISQWNINIKEYIALVLIIFVPCIYCILLAVFLPKQNNFRRVDPKKKKKKKRTWQRMNHVRLKNNRMSLWGFLTSKTGRNQNISAPWTATGLSLTLFIRLCTCVCVCARAIHRST